MPAALHRRAARPVRLPRARVAVLAVGALAALMAVVVAYRFLMPTAVVPAGTVLAGKASSFPQESVTYVPAGRFFLVRSQGEQFIALFERSPWLVQHAANYGEDGTACRIRWNRRTAPGAGDNGGEFAGTADSREPIMDPAYGAGLFVETCDGWRFDARGRHIFGAALALTRFPVRLLNGDVMVDTSRPDNTWWQDPNRY